MDNQTVLNNFAAPMQQERRFAFDVSINVDLIKRLKKHKKEKGCAPFFYQCFCVLIAGLVSRIFLQIIFGICAIFELNLFGKSPIYWSENPPKILLLIGTAINLTLIVLYNIFVKPVNTVKRRNALGEKRVYVFDENYLRCDYSTTVSSQEFKYEYMFIVAIYEYKTYFVFKVNNPGVIDDYGVISKDDIKIGTIDELRKFLIEKIGKKYVIKESVLPPNYSI